MRSFQIAWLLACVTHGNVRKIDISSAAGRNNFTLVVSFGHVYSSTPAVAVGNKGIGMLCVTLYS
jgi:hypothetical protein